MKCYAQFYGGLNYSHPQADEYEIFESLKAAREAFENRVDHWNRQYPCTDKYATMTVFIGAPEPERYPYSCDTYPDYQIMVGPRGGINIRRVH